MILNYTETEEDRIEGLKIFHKKYDTYGSRKLIVILSIFVCSIFLLSTLLKLDLISNLDYLYLFVACVNIWYFGIMFFFHEKKFKENKNIYYVFDSKNNSFLLNHKTLYIKRYYHTDKYILFEYDTGYISISKVKINQDFLDIYSKFLEELRTWKDTLFWSFIGIVFINILISLTNYY